MMLSCLALALALCLIVQGTNAGARIDVPEPTNYTVGALEGAPESTYFSTTLPSETRLHSENNDDRDDSFSFSTMMYVLGGCTLVMTLGCLRGCKIYSNAQKKQWDLEQERSRRIALEREEMEKRTSTAHTALSTHSPIPLLNQHRLQIPLFQPLSPQTVQ